MSVEFKSNKEEVLAALADAIKQGLEIIGGAAEGYAADQCPVDTGRLQGSIAHEPEGDKTMVVGTNVEYAPYVELGTRKMRSQPFLRPAAEDHVSQYKSIMRRVLGG